MPNTTHKAIRDIVDASEIEVPAGITVELEKDGSGRTVGITLSAPDGTLILNVREEAYFAAASWTAG